MVFMDSIAACNRHSPDNFIPFLVDGVTVGCVTPQFADIAACYAGLSKDRVGLHYRPPAGDIVKRSDDFLQVQQALVEDGVISHLHGEKYIATPGDRSQGVLLVDRAAAPYFGIRAFGQHINGYLRRGDELLMWLGRRASDRKHFPGYLDNIAAGGLPWDITLPDNLRKECWEEAGISPALADNARPVSAITYCLDTEKGCKPDTLYCYDLELPEDFSPACKDGEVEAFLLLPIERVIELVEQGDQFKLNCNLVVIDFLIRHGYLGPERADYIELVTGLHAQLPEF